MQAMAGRRTMMWVARVILLFMVTHLLAPAPLLSRAAGAETGTSPSAQELFDRADYAGALESISTAIARGGPSTPDALLAAHILRARCLVALGRDADAIEAFCQIMRLDPRWEPDPYIYKTTEVSTFQRAQTICQPAEEPGASQPAVPPPPEPRKKSKKKFIFGGVALLVGGIAAMVAGGGGSGGGSSTNGTLPAFPDPPR